MNENFKTDLLFPPRIILELSDIRSKVWQKLVRRTSEVEEGSREQLAFIYTMVRLNGCATCGADSFRAMQGCASCTKQSLKRFRGSDEDLISLYKSAETEVDQYFKR